MREYGILTVLQLMQDSGVNSKNFRSFIEEARNELRKEEIDDEMYFLKVASILSNANAEVTLAEIEAIFSPWKFNAEAPWKENELEGKGAHYSFWLLLEQFGHHGPHNRDYHDWMYRRFKHCIKFVDHRSDSQLMLFLSKGWWLGEPITDSICLWILHNHILGPMSILNYSDQVVKEALDYSSRRVGKGGFAEEISDFEERSGAVEQ
ncbi:hypothetical protein GOD41_08515 [Sinorhizobium medicae]|nr:hypothetical protein [Sinorhizobium medicae]